MSQIEREFTLRIVAEDLDKIDFSSYGSRIRLAIQKGKEVEYAVPISAGTAQFEARFRVQPSGEAVNFLGPYAQGPRDGRFVYLVWLSESGSFGRIKLHLSSLRWEQIEAGKPIAMRLSLLGKGGKPVFATVKNARVSWE